MRSSSGSNTATGRSVGEGDRLSHVEDGSLCGAVLATMTEIEIPSHLSYLETDMFCPSGGSVLVLYSGSTL